MNRTGAKILVDGLVQQGATQAFCVPGESFLAVLDALVDAPLAMTVCRQEGGAAMMAEAQGKLTGRPGLCFVTRGPGATNASAGVHIAAQDSTPMILFIGQIEMGFRGREAFQEVDYQQFFGGMAKWVCEIEEAKRIPEILSRAYSTAMNGRPGPVVLVLPENMLVEEVDVQDTPFIHALETAATAQDLKTLQHMLEKAQKPVLILGGSRWNAQAVKDIQAFAENFGLPVVCQFRRQMLFPHTHPNYRGDLGLGCNPKLLNLIKSSDCVVLVGGRMGEIPSQAYTLFDIPTPKQPFIHIHAGAEELGRVYNPTLRINASPQTIAAQLVALKATQKHIAGESFYPAWSAPVTVQGKMQMAQIIKQLPNDAIICNGAGNYATWIHRFHTFTRYNTQLAPTSGSMGYGVPAAVGAKALDKTKTVIAFAGDGCFMMTGQEFATAVQYGLNIIVIIVDNGMYGTIRMHQEKHYPKRVSHTDLVNPDFVALAQSYGGYGEAVRETQDFAPALQRAIASQKPSILHLFLDKEVISPTTTLTKLRGD